MATNIPFHLIERDPHRSIFHWIYIFDRGGRRHILGINPVELDAQRPRLVIRHHLVRKGISLGSLEATSLAADDLTCSPLDFAFFDHLIDDPLQLGEPVAGFLLRHVHRIAAHAGCSAHKQMNLSSAFRETLMHAREARKQAAADRRDRLQKTRAAGFVPKVDLKDGRLVRLCPKWHRDLSTDALSTIYRVSRKARARRYSLVAVDGLLKGKRFAPPGFQQVYLAADVERA